MNNKIRLIAVVTLFALLLIASPVTARYSAPEGDNAGIDIGDTVFIGERNLDFSEFENPEMGDLTRLVCIKDGDISDFIEIKDGVATSIRPEYDGRGEFWAYYNDGSNRTWDDNRYCTISDPDTGRIEIRPYNTDERPESFRPGAIPDIMNVQFILPDNNLENGNFAAPWYEYDLRDPSGARMASVTSWDGMTIPLKNLESDPSREYSDLAFNFLAQGHDEGEYTLTFRTLPDKLNGLSEETEYSFDVRNYPFDISLDSTEVTRGDSLTLTLKGQPYQHFTVSLEPGGGNPHFDPNGDYDTPDPYEITVHPEWGGEKQITILTETDTEETYYGVSAFRNSNPSGEKSLTFQVGAEEGQVSDVSFDEDEDDDFQYAVGDKVPIKLKLEFKSKGKHGLYLFVRGPNIAEEGAPLGDPFAKVVDGNPGTFTWVEAPEGSNEFEGCWNTQGKSLSPETYTIYAVSTPTDYEHLDIDNFDSHEINLDKPTIDAKLPRDTGSFFAQGDEIYFRGAARGSPNMIEDPIGKRGKIFWYIFGKNFRYAEYERIMIKEPPKGKFKVICPRSFSYNMTPGTYTLVLQHPMYNDLFDILPNGDKFHKGTFDYLEDPEGKIDRVDLTQLQSSEGAYALENALDSPDIDDSYLLDTFEIEKPWIRIDTIGNIRVGDELSVKGTTNLAGGCKERNSETSDKTDEEDVKPDELVLTIRCLDMSPGEKSQSAYKLYADTEEVDDEVISGRHARKFEFDPVPKEVTSAMRAGQYLIEVKCEKTRTRYTQTFNVNDEGYIRGDNGTVAAPTDPSLRTEPVETPEWRDDVDEHEHEAWTPVQTPSAVPEPTESPLSPVCAVIAGLLASGFVTMRR